MPQRADRDFQLDTGRASRPWFALALLLVAGAAFWLWRMPRAPRVTTTSAQATVSTSTDSAPATALPPPRGNRRLPVPASADVPPPPAPAATVATAVTATATPRVVADTPPGARMPVMHPVYGDGRLWVEPLDESPKNIASALTGKTPKQLTDSMVSSMVQTYLDQMAAERAQNGNGLLPSWTTKIGGKTVGLDQKWIYLGPIRIPAALLALLPLHVQANPTMAEYNAKLQVMRDDLMEAARRAATYEDFKKAVKELHDQSDGERQFKHNQSVPPDSGHSE